MILCSFAILLALILSASCAAAERVQHAAVLAPNGTIYIIGGTPINTNTETEQQQITTTTAVTRQKIDVNHDIITSHYQSPGQHQQQPMLLLQGHTAHWNPLKNEPVTLFGTPAATKESESEENDDRALSTLPIPRYHHASSIENDKSDIYVVGGRDFQGRILKDIWKLSLDSMKWVQLYQLEHHRRGFAGHSTVLYRNWLISCLGVTKNNNNNDNEDENVGGCTLCFDTNLLIEQSCKNHGNSGLPLGRTEAGLTQIQEQDNIVIVHGGLSNNNNNNLLGDIWQLDLTQTPDLVWSQIKLNLPPRAGHSLVPLNGSTLLLYGGRLDNNDTPAPIEYLDVSTVTTKKSSPLHKRAPPEETDPKNRALPTSTPSKPEPTTITKPSGSSSSKVPKSRSVTTEQQATETETETGVSTNDGQQQSSEKGGGGLTGGAAAGIVIGVLALVGIIIGVFIWTRKQQRRRMRYFHNRASRFSLSTPPPSRPASIRMGGKTASLPEMSHIPATVDPSRLSTLSFGSDFRLPAHHENQQSSQRASYSSVSMPQSRFDTRTDSFIQQNHLQDRGMVQYPEPIAMTAAQQRRQHRDSSQSFKRLTLNIPSALRTTAIGGGSNGIGGETPTSARDETTPSPSILKRYTVAGLAERRRSSMFGFRASRLLHIPGNANTNNSSTTTTSSITDEPISRMSLDARSVSSVQWVGFNDSMDYREQQWNPTVQLAVTNEQKRRSVSSSRPTSCAAESLGSSASPRSAMFRFSNTSAHQPYRLSTQELHSWDDHINQRVLRTRNSNHNSSSNGQSSGSSSSLPTSSRAIERFNNYRVSTSSDESSIVVTSGTAAATTSHQQ